MTSNTNLKSLVFGTAVTSLLLCSPLYSQVTENDANCLTEDSVGMQLLNSTLSANPNSKFAKLACAKVFLKNGNYKEAKELIQQVLLKHPNYKQAYKLLNELELVYKVKDESKEPPILEPKEETNPKEETKPQVKIEIKAEPLTEIVVEKKQEPKINIKGLEPAEIKESRVGDFKPDIKSEEKVTLIVEKEVKKPVDAEKKLNSILNLIKGTDTESKEKMPSRKEILAKAKARQQATTASVVVVDAPIVNPVIVSEPKVSEEIPSNKDKKKVSLAQALLEKAKAKRDAESQKLDVTTLPLEEVFQGKVVEDQNKDSVIYSSDGMTFEPYVAGKVNKQKSYESLEKDEASIVAADLTKPITDVSKLEFLKATSKSFNIMLDEALSKLENNKLAEADNYLDKASIIAISKKDDNKLFEAQLSRSVTYIYALDFPKYGKHITSLQRVASPEIYKSLLEIFERSSLCKTENEKLNYAAGIALDSGHYITAIELASKVKPQDLTSEKIINAATKNVNSLNSEALLNRGSYLSALEIFQKENDLAEVGRTYLAISKSLEEAGEALESKVAENFGKSSLMLCIKNEPNNPKANLYLALYYLDNGNKDLAKEAIRRGLNANSNNELITSKLLNLSSTL